MALEVPALRRLPVEVQGDTVEVVILLPELLGIPGRRVRCSEASPGPQMFAL